MKSAVTRVVISGAGGIVFPLKLAADFLALEALRGAQLVLHDPQIERAQRTARAVQEVAEHHKLPLNLKVTADRRAALRGATHVLLTFQVGGLDAYRSDIEIPRRYGLDCVAGDTLNPGGIMRFVRSSAAFGALAADVRELCQDALVLNYTNPMAMNTLYLHWLGVRVVGLCHSIPGTASMLAGLLDVPEKELEYRAAGINHQAWFLELKHQGQDLQPRLLKTLRERFLPEYGGDTPWTEGSPAYVGGQERVRAELMDTFGYFLSESSHHVSEYVPYFRRTPEQIKAYLPRRWDYLRGSVQGAGKEDETTAGAVEHFKRELRPSAEFGMRIVAAQVGGELPQIYGNIVNDGWISNLPTEACVEVPCQVDRMGVRPEQMGRLPARCAGLNLTNIAVQLAAVEAVVNRDPDALNAAVALDPLTASLLDLRDIRQLTRELVQAQQPWLPEWLHV